MSDTSSPTLIALSGLAGSGKDEAARQLAADGWERRAFADKLRAVAYALDPVIGIRLDAQPLRLVYAVEAWGWERTKRDYPEVRRLLQRLGTEGGRHVLGEDVWVDAALRDLPARCILTDCRFPNEAQAVHELGGLVFRLERPGVQPIVGPDGNVHPSETALDGYPFDAVVHNRGTVADLGRLLREAIDWHSG